MNGWKLVLGYISILMKYLEFHSYRIQITRTNKLRIKKLQKQYLELLSKMPSEIRWEDLSFYETEDGTSGTQTLACTSDGNCEIVDISA